MTPFTWFMTYLIVGAPLSIWALCCFTRKGKGYVTVNDLFYITMFSVMPIMRELVVLVFLLGELKDSNFGNKQLFRKKQ